MAIGTPVERYASAPNANSTSQALSLATDSTVGNTLILCLVLPVGAKASSVTDTKSNAWTVDRTYANGSNNMSVSFASCNVATQILATDTITVNFTANVNGNRSIWVQEVSGLATSSRYDTGADNSNGATQTSLTVGPTATLGQADEIAFAGFRCTGSSLTKDAAWSSPTTGLLDTNHSLLEYKIVSSTSALSTTATAASSFFTGSIATYKAAATGTPSDPAQNSGSAAPFLIVIGATA